MRSLWRWLREGYQDRTCALCGRWAGKHRFYCRRCQPQLKIAPKRIGCCTQVIKMSNAEPSSVQAQLQALINKSSFGAEAIRHVIEGVALVAYHLRDTSIEKLDAEVARLTQERDAQFAHNTALQARLDDAIRDNDMVNDYLARIEGIVNGTGGTGHIQWNLYERIEKLVGAESALTGADPHAPDSGTGDVTGLKEPRRCMTCLDVHPADAACFREIVRWQLKVKDDKELLECVRGLQERVKFTEDFETLKAEVERLTQENAALLTSLQSAQEQRDAKMLTEINAVWTLNSENEPQAFTDAIIAIRKLLRPSAPQEPT